MAMTQAQLRAYGLVIPSLPQLWLTAMLRVVVELVRNAASIFWMIIRRPPVIGTQAMPADLPRETSDTIKEHHAVPHDSPIALILSSAQGARPSKSEQTVRVADELVQWTNSSGERRSDSEGGVLTAVSHTSQSEETRRLRAQRANPETVSLCRRAHLERAKS